MRAVDPEVSLSHEQAWGRQSKHPPDGVGEAVVKMKTKENKKDLKGAGSALGVAQKNGQKKKKHVSVKAQIRSVQRLLKKVTYVDSCL